MALIPPQKANEQNLKRPKHYQVTELQQKAQENVQAYNHTTLQQSKIQCLMSKKLDMKQCRKILHRNEKQHSKFGSKLALMLE